MDISHEKFLELKANLHTKGLMDIEISGKSMTPLIQHGDKIKIVPVQSTEQLTPFTTIVFWHKNKLICHSIIRRNQLVTDRGQVTYSTAGLGHGQEDLPLIEDQILGLSLVKLNFWHKLLFFWRWRKS